MEDGDLDGVFDNASVNHDIVSYVSRTLTAVKRLPSLKNDDDVLESSR